MNRTQGLTLIELLIVIAIIGIRPPAKVRFG
jgi:prepilin-type N-terminal cleavage/methylation domain-containing protein